MMRVFVAGATGVALALGAKKPMRVPRFIGRLLAGEKRELAWRPAHPRWRQGCAAP